MHTHTQTNILNVIVYTRVVAAPVAQLHAVGAQSTAAIHNVAHTFIWSLSSSASCHGPWATLLRQASPLRRRATPFFEKAKAPHCRNCCCAVFFSTRAAPRHTCGSRHTSSGPRGFLFASWSSLSSRFRLFSLSLQLVGQVQRRAAPQPDLIFQRRRQRLLHGQILDFAALELRAAVRLGDANARFVEIEQLLWTAV